MNKNNILVIGNGFDLACGIKSGVNSFLDSTINKFNNPLFSFLYEVKSVGIMENPDWNSFEKQICQYLNCINYLFSNNENVDYKFEDKHSAIGCFEDFYNVFVIKIKDLNKLPLNVYETLKFLKYRRDFGFYSDEGLTKGVDELNNYNNGPIFIGYFIEIKESKANKIFVLNDILSKLEAELDGLEGKLQEYILDVQTKIDDKKKEKLYDLISKLGINRAISFNYSHTLSNYFDIKEDSVHYVHGDVNNKVIIGIEENMIENQSFGIDSIYRKFFKRYRRIMKDTLNHYSNNMLDSISLDTDIYVYGHSLDLSDSSILKELFNTNCRTIVIYCYENILNYKDKLFNMIGIDKMEKLVKEDRLKFITIT